MKQFFFLVIILVLSYNVIYAQDYALQFDGNDEYVQTTYGGEIRTLEFWFKTNSFDTFDGLFGQRFDDSEESGNWQMHWDDYGDHKRLRIYAYDPSGGEMITTASFEAGQWYHIAITSEPNDLNYYINGVHDSQHTWMDYVLGGGGNDDDLTIGGSFGNSNLYPFDGELDEVRVWSDVRTEAEIQEYLCCGLTGTETNLIAYYTMSDGSGSSLTDNSSNSYTGTLHNMEDGDWVTGFEAYSGGSGTSGDPYQIASTNDLINLSNISGCWDDYFIQTANISFDATEANVDWDNNGSAGPAEGFSPIGNSTANFTGSYDGGEYTIDNLFIDRSSTDYVGIFGETGGSSIIKNLGLINNDIYGKRYVGGVAGYNNGEIDNCYTTGPVRAYNQDVGGIAGVNYGPVTNCHAEGDISASGHPTDCETAGGLVGDNRGTIDNCYATGNVSVPTSGNTTGWEVGGLVGYSYNTSGIYITNSYATGTVTGIEEVGGLVGDNKNTLSNCYARGSVSASTQEGGGLVGVNYGPISNSYSTGSVTGSSEIGGLVGDNSTGGSVSNSFWDTETSETETGIGGGTTTGATGKTTTIMKNVETFTDENTSGLTTAWDFVTNPNDDEADNNYWDIDGTSTINDGYPFLSWENGDDTALPVTLSSFTSQFLNGNAVLSWTTQSESNNLGWNIYRSSENDFEEASLLNYELIPGAGTTTETTDYSYEDESDFLPVTTYWYWLESVSGNGETANYGPVTLTVPSAEDDTPELPENTMLYGNFPNPFNPTTEIKFDIKEGETGELTIINVRGQTVHKMEFEAGSHAIQWEGDEVGSGVYFYRLETASYSRIEKMLMIK